MENEKEKSNIVDAMRQFSIDEYNFISLREAKEEITAICVISRTFCLTRPERKDFFLVRILSSR